MNEKSTLMVRQKKVKVKAYLIAPDTGELASPRSITLSKLR